MQFTFDFDKTRQAAAAVLQRHAGRMGVMRLLKILYIADRELLASTGHTLTGDRAVAMKNGPVLSTTYDLLKSNSPRAAEWAAVFRRDGYQVQSCGDPGTGRLSKGEVDLLAKLCERFHDTDDWDLSDHTHTFAEWKAAWDSAAGAAAIDWADVLAAEGKTDWVPAIERDIRSRAVFDSVFGGRA